jgi:hypothetical protein
VMQLWSALASSTSSFGVFSTSHPLDSHGVDILCSAKHGLSIETRTLPAAIVQLSICTCAHAQRAACVCGRGLVCEHAART